MLPERPLSSRTHEDDAGAVERFWERYDISKDRLILWAALLELTVGMCALILGWIPTG